MENNTHYIADPVLPLEEATESGFTFGEFGRKVFKGDKVIWSVFIILCVISLVEIFSATSTIVYRQQNMVGTHSSACYVFNRRCRRDSVDS